MRWPRRKRRNAIFSSLFLASLPEWKSSFTRTQCLISPALEWLDIIFLENRISYLLYYNYQQRQERILVSETTAGARTCAETQETGRPRCAPVRLDTSWTRTRRLAWTWTSAWRRTTTTGRRRRAQGTTRTASTPPVASCASATWATSTTRSWTTASVSDEANYAKAQKCIVEYSMI